MCLRVLVAALFFQLIPAAAFAQFSPGPLSQSHASLEGVLKCSTCHSLGLGRQELKCSSCHMEILDRLRNKRGYHARVVDVSKADADCVSCHKEHVGRDFELIRWPQPGRSGFDHAQTGYTLEGKHRTLQCEGCHNEKKIVPAQRAAILMTDLNKSFLGLGTDCLSCHADTHRGQLGSDCSSCHTQDSWKSTTRFDHSRSRFPLTGLHTSVSCQQCHAPQGGPANAGLRFTGLNFSECSGCHRDPHRGAVGASCAACHTTAGWTAPTPNSKSGFDHSRTRYPLTGRHSSLACASCHKTADFSDHIASGQCRDCHKDKHDGQFAKRADKGDCGSCHTVDRGFEFSTFDVKAHAQTPYPLMGRHSAVACKGCHATKNGFTNYHPNSGNCTDCHKDSHAGQFATRADKGECNGCHRLDRSFEFSTFDVKAHAETRYPLMGRHSTVACKDCHTTNNRFTDYHPNSGTCTDCHKDAHAGQFAARYENKCDACHVVDGFTPSTFTLARHRQSRFDLLGAHLAIACTDCHKKTDERSPHQYVFDQQTCASCHRDPHDLGSQPAPCETCHSVNAWVPVKGFDHTRTRFTLLGSHRVVDCVSCHPPLGAGQGQHVRFRGAPMECSGCHEDIHAGQFAGRPGAGECSSCHTAAQWKPATGFDHGTSAFPLDGAHQNVRCVLCHSKTTPVNGRETLVFRSAPTECKSCH